jgi:hypothetical protein
MHDPCKRHVSHRNAVRILRGGALCHAQNFGDHYATLLVTPTFLSLKLTFLSLKLTFLRVARPAAAAVAPSACALSGKWDTCMHAAQQHARCRCCFQCVFSVFSVCFQCVFSVFSVCFQCTTVLAVLACFLSPGQLMVPYTSWFW